MKAGPNRSDRSIDAEAAKWVVRCRAGLDEGDRRQMEDWLAARPEHRAAYVRLSAISAVFQRARDEGTATSIVTELRARSRERRMRQRAVGAGTLVILGLAVAYWFRPTLNPLGQPTAEVAAPFEPIRRLPDGSIVELREGAEIAVKFEKTLRRVTLVHGEALFRVEHDRNRPFIVTANGIEVRAVGTAFDVKLDAATMEVLVTEGKIRVDDAVRGGTLLPRTAEGDATLFAGAAEPVLSAGQEAIVKIDRRSDPNPIRVAELRSEEIEQSLSWRIPRLNFDGIDLADAVQKLNQLNRVQIVLADDSLAKLHISGTFAPDDPETFSRLAATTFGLKVRHPSEGKIVLAKN